MIINGRQFEETSMQERAKLDAIRHARERTARERRQYVVREDGSRYLVCPLYEAGREGEQHDAGYAALGTLVAESLKGGG
jgi:hypothetical protein